MHMRVKKCLILLLLVTLFCSASVFYFGYFCADSVCALSWVSKNDVTDLASKLELNGAKIVKSDVSEHVNLSFEEVTAKDFQFDIRGHDVIVFLHIQKTGGTTFGRHLVRDLDLERDCQCHRKLRKRCTCLRPGPNSKETWLFSRYSTGWKCGLHADWTELTSCVDEMLDKIEDNEVQRRYFYITYMRDPIHRYLSEYRHVRRGATWKAARLWCLGRSATKEEVPPCFASSTWENVTINEFMSCKSNLAANRQTRMLADLSLVDCYNSSSLERNAALLQSAKKNLKKMSFVGITEMQQKSQYIFEETFNLRFSVRFEQYNATMSEASLMELDETLLQEIKEINLLDVELFEFAKQLLEHRYQTLSSQDPHFQEHFNSLGKINFDWNSIQE